MVLGPYSHSRSIYGPFLGQKQEAFAALLGDGSVVCWGSERLGGNSAEVKERDLQGAS